MLRQPEIQSFRPTMSLANHTMGSNSFDLASNGSYLRELSNCGGQLTPEYEATWSGFTYWCEGVLTVGVGMIGMVGNILSIAVLVTRDMRKHSFNQLLVGLAIFDLTFIVCGVPVHAFPILNISKLTQLVQSWMYGVVYKYFLYPFTTISYTGSVYMTTAITIERYIAVCKPLRYREFIAELSPNVRTMIYVIPVTIFSVLLNLPKFFEIEVAYYNGTLEYFMADLRTDPTYVWWYTHSFIIHPFLTTTILPICLLCGLNYKIYRGICASRCRVQASNNHGEVNLAMVFVTICSIFVCCHILRIILALQAFTRASEISDCIASNKSYIPPIELVCMESISHIMIMINSSCNFIVYCTLSTHFKVFMCKLFYKRARHSITDPNHPALSTLPPRILWTNASSMKTNLLSICSTPRDLELRPLQPRKPLVVGSIPNLAIIRTHSCPLSATNPFSIDLEASRTDFQSDSDFPHMGFPLKTSSSYEPESSHIETPDG